MFGAAGTSLHVHFELQSSGEGGVNPHPCSVGCEAWIRVMAALLNSDGPGLLAIMVLEHRSVRFGKFY